MSNKIKELFDKAAEIKARLQASFEDEPAPEEGAAVEMTDVDGNVYTATALEVGAPIQRVGQEGAEEIADGVTIELTSGELVAIEGGVISEITESPLAPEEGEQASDDEKAFSKTEVEELIAESTAALTEKFNALSEKFKVFGLDAIAHMGEMEKIAEEYGEQPANDKPLPKVKVAKKMPELKGFKNN